MTDDKNIYIPFRPLRTARSSVLTTFEPLPVDIVFEKDVAVTLRDGIVGRR